MKQNLDELFGPSGRGDYKPGDTIAFVEGSHELSGEIIHVSAPQMTVTGKQLPTTYEVDCGDGWPHIVLSSQIVQRSGERVEE